MEILRPLMIRRIQNPQMKRMAIPAMRMLPISLVLLTMEMQIHQRILKILTNQTTQMALAALIQRIHRHVPTYPLLLVRLLARWRIPFCRINS